MRATNGNALTNSGNMIERVPTDVPMTTRVTGKSMTSSMMNGTERRKLITTSSTLLNVGSGRMPPLRVMTRSTPSGRPTR